MKKHAPTAIAVIALILVVVCLFQIAELKSQIWSVHNGLSSQISGVRSSVDNIHANIANTLNEQANLLVNSTWTFDEADIDAETVTIRCVVTPKEYSPDSTSVVLVCNDAEYSMALENGEYIVVLPIPLFGESILSMVQLIDDGTVRTEVLDWWISPRFEFLPQINAYFIGSSGVRRVDGKLSLHRDGEIEINIYQYENSVIVQSISMLEYIDGEEIERTNIPLNTIPSTRQDGAVREEPARRIYGYSEMPTDFYCSLNKIVEIPTGSTYEMYIELVDNYGFHYRVLLDHIIDSDDNRVEDMVFEIAIYDGDGNVLWVPDKEFFY